MLVFLREKAYPAWPRAGVKKVIFYGLGGLLASLADFWGPKGSTQGPLGPPQDREEWPGDPPVSHRTLSKNINLQKLKKEPHNDVKMTPRATKWAQHSKKKAVVPPLKVRTKHIYA